MIRTSVFIVLTPVRTWEGRVTAIRPDRMLVTRPKLRVSEVAVELILDIDERLFEQFLPQVIVPITGERELVIPEVAVQDQEPGPEPGDDGPADVDEHAVGYKVDDEILAELPF